MAVSELELIRRCFERRPLRPDVALGVGDDAALLRPGEGLLAAAADALTEGVHFPPGTAPEAVGHKALAVNLSDLAAMGAEPAWALLALGLPGPELAWTEGFARGFLALARSWSVELVGGDTTRSPVRTAAVTVLGRVPDGQVLRRDGARPGDLVCVTGTLGDAALALRLLREGAAPHPWLRARLERPVPRLAEGRALRGLAGACIDLSDGLVADLGRVLEASAGAAGTPLAARIELSRLPASPAFREAAEALGGARRWALQAAGGDDYELCFTLPAGRLTEARRRLEPLGTPVTALGTVEATQAEEAGVHLLDPEGHPWRPPAPGYDAFSGPGGEEGP